MPTLSKERKDRLLGDLVDGPVWIGLMTEDEVEVSSRQRVTFGQPQSEGDVRYVENAEAVRFPTFSEPPAGRIAYWFLADSHRGEGYYLLVKLDEPREARRGDAPIFEAGELSIAIP